jgi:hypothetical protein
MRIECAVLCDAASLREGLLNIIGGGISTVAFQHFPAPLPLTFALRVVLDTHELRDDEPSVRLELVNAVNEEHIEAAATVDFRIPERHRRQLTQEAAFAGPVPLSGFTITGPGKYLIKAQLGNHTLGTFPLRIDATDDAVIAEELADEKT